MNVCTKNVPISTKWDLKIKWEQLHKQLPNDFCGKHKWAKSLYECTRESFKTRQRLCPDSREVYTFKRLVDGLRIGPLDKNNGELWCCCPTLYNKALEKAFSQETGYVEIHPKKLTTYKKKKFPLEKDLTNNILGTSPAEKRQQGSEKDIMALWRWQYKQRGWSSVVGLRQKCGLNTPYILFKAKNVTDATTRKDKLYKVRPIAPGTKHPMKPLLGLVGRAWHFISKQVPGENFVINSGEEVPAFLEEAQTKLRPQGKMEIRIRDIDSCYPSMDKDEIKMALRETVEALQNEKGYDGVWVPKRSTTQPCSWKRGRAKAERKVFLPFAEMIDVVNFALDNTFVKMPDGRILKQNQGIPMGDPTSPGITIVTCARMESKFNIHKGDPRGRKEEFLCKKIHG